jgi:hypothetical protein
MSAAAAAKGSSPDAATLTDEDDTDNFPWEGYFHNKAVRRRRGTGGNQGGNARNRTACNALEAAILRCKRHVSLLSTSCNISGYSAGRSEFWENVRNKRTET